MLRLLLVASTLVAASLPMAASTSPGKPQLNAKVTSRAISLTDANGQRVKVLLRNSYLLTVKDLSRTQNFHLVGPGLNLRTRPGATVTRTWSVDLRPGIYVYKSDKSPRLRGTFTVKGGPAPA